MPGGDASPPPGSARPALKSFGGTDSATAPPRPARDSATAGAPPAKADGSSLLDELAAIEGVKRPRRVESVLPSRSEVMEQVRQKAVEQQSVETEQSEEKAKTRKKKKKKKKTSSYFDPKDTLILIGGVGAFVAVLGFLGWRFPDMRFPIGGLLCVIGFIVYLLGAASLRQLVAEEGAFQAILFRFFPPYQWWFVISRWSETKDFFIFFASGLMILGIGGAIIKTSPIGKKAEESERAYQKARRGSIDEGPPPVVKDSAAEDE